MEIMDIATKIKNLGGSLYLVGGAVRNELLGLPSDDSDFCVVGLSSEEFLSLFSEAKLIGKSFKVFLLEHQEFALARREVKTGVGHKSFTIETGKNITIEEDLARRDLTVNAIAKNVLTHELIDPFNGQKDIQSRILRATTNAFIEDPLRVYRTARFAATLEFKIESSTLSLMKKIKNELSSLSAERVFLELQKALASKKPSIFFEVLKQANLLDVHFPEIAQLIGSLQPEKYHPEGDSFNHTMQVIDLCASKTDNLAVRFAALVHDLGKGITPEEEYPHHHGHDKKGVPLVVSLGNRIRVPKLWIDYGKTACREHMLGGIFGRMTPGKKVSFIERVSHSSLGLENLQLVVDSDRNGRGSYVPSEKEYQDSQFLSISLRCLKEINGDYILSQFPNLEGEKLGNKLHEERIKWLVKNLA